MRLELVSQCEPQHRTRYAVETCVLILGAIASCWMLLSLRVKFSKSSQIDWTLALIAASHFVCCFIKASYRTYCLGSETPHQSVFWQTVYPISNVALMAAFLYQSVLTVLIFHVIRAKERQPIKLWVCHLIVLMIALTRGLQGLFIQQASDTLLHYYGAVLSFCSCLIVLLYLVRAQRHLKHRVVVSQHRALGRIRLAPIAYIVCTMPRTIHLVLFASEAESRGDHDATTIATNVLFYSFFFIISLVYGASRRSCGCLPQQQQQHPTAASLRIDPQHVAFCETDVIGYGGNSVIYRGMYRGGAVAIKRIPLRGMIVSSESQRMFEQEASLLSRLVHPNIVYFMGAYIQRTDGYIVVEYCNRGSLRSLLDQMDVHHCRIVDWIWRCKIALGAARGLLYLHQTAQPSIIHRDLKSPNVLVNDSFSAKVADFGTARLVSMIEQSQSRAPASSTTRTMDGMMTTNLGTARWTAPEIVEAFSQGRSVSSYSEAVDIYSFGLILWELTTFEIPFHELKFNAQVHDAVVEGKRPALGARRGAEPVEWQPLITSCWAQDPAARPPIALVVRTLQRILSRLKRSLKKPLETPQPPTSCVSQTAVRRDVV